MLSFLLLIILFSTFSLIHIATAVPNYARNSYIGDYQAVMIFWGIVECVEKCGRGVEFFHKKVWKRRSIPLHTLRFGTPMKIFRGVICCKIYTGHQAGVWFSRAGMLTPPAALLY